MFHLDSLTTAVGEFLSQWEQLNAIFVDGMEYVPVTVIDTLMYAMTTVAAYVKLYFIADMACVVAAVFIVRALFVVLKRRKRDLPSNG